MVLKYFKLSLKAILPDTMIYIADPGGHLVQQGRGTLSTSLLPGDYSVLFGRQAEERKISLKEDTEIAESK